MNIWMVASENDALAGAKVGGLADVVRDAPPALVRQGCRVTVVVPAYNFLHTLEGASKLQEIIVEFRGYPHFIAVYEVPGKHPDVTQLVLQHPDLWALGPNQLYYHDTDRPFATDANRFALFCRAAAGLLIARHREADCIHLHDWPAAMLMILRQYHPACEPLKRIRTVFTIHNLAMQGIRPFRGDESSLEAWFPGLPYDGFAIADRRWTDSVNPMAAAIRLADAVHAVSPTYAEEIREPDRRPEFFGGEGLENDLRYAAGQNRLFGILNGCAYPEDREPPMLEFKELLRQVRSSVISWAGGHPNVESAHFIAHARLDEWMQKSEPPALFLTSVSRVVDQKLLLLIAHGSNGRHGLENLLESIGNNRLFILLGLGDFWFEQFLVNTSAKYENFIFLKGFSGQCAEMLYANGDLFVMPSSFEPCGISQMLAMRDGQPCLVHRVGGLKDTVHDEVDGFSFEGGSLAEQVDNMTETAKRAISISEKDPERWAQIRKQAAEARFSWDDTAKQYIEHLYRVQ